MTLAGPSAAVPYFDLKRQVHYYGLELRDAVLRVVESGQYVLSPEVRQFEEEFARYHGVRHAVSVGSGTDALVFALKALGLSKGDEVIVPSFTFSASVFAILHAGARPVFAEVSPLTYTLDPESVLERMTSRTKAILPVHLYGQTADMDSLRAIAKKKRLKIIEDACQAHGATWRGKKAGTFGDAGAFSFYPTKNLGAMGDGGMVMTSSAGAAQKIRCFRNLGRENVRQPHRFVGWTSRLDAVQAAVLRVKLRYLDHFNHSRRKAAELYKQKLADTPLGLPLEAPGARHGYHLFVVRVPEGRRDALQKKLAREGIGTLVHYPVPAHRQPALKAFAPPRLRLKVTDRLCREILSLPMFPEITDEEVERVCSVIRDFYSR